MEFLIFAKEAVNDRRHNGDALSRKTDRQAFYLSAAVRDISSGLKSHALVFEALQRLRPYYVLQRRGAIFNKLFSTSFPEHANSSLSTTTEPHDRNSAFLNQPYICKPPYLMIEIWRTLSGFQKRIDIA
jgi:hypothetical protein